MEFYGQRPWRPGKVNAEPPDPYLESRGIQALQYIEKQVNHSVCKHSFALRTKIAKSHTFRAS